jgi:hypothetical protein
MNLEYTNLHTMLTQPDIYVSTFTVVLGDKLFLGEQDLFKSFGFGVAVAAGSFAGPLIANKLKLQTLFTKPAHDISPADKDKARALALKMSRIGGSVAFAYLVNSLILKKNFQFSQLPLIAGADLMAEYVQAQYSKKKWDDFVNQSKNK